MPDVQLLDRLREAGLLLPEQVAELAALPEATVADPRPLARLLLAKGWLTRLQVNFAAAGRAAELVVGPYVILDRLGEGGAGQVFKARHRRMDRIVALKIMRKEKLASADSIQRFYQEAQAAAGLSHPNIVQAYDAGPAGATHFLAMELVEGLDLARLVRQQGPLSVALACEYARQAALGLGHAHDRGLVHRDVKPSNLLLAPDGVVKVLDFGLARQDDSFGRERKLTQLGQVVGTPDYLAPEQALDARKAGPQADLYGLGGALHFLLTGAPPYEATALAELLLKHQTAPPPSARARRADVPVALDVLIQRLMAKRPGERPQTAAEVASALAPFARGQAGAPPPPPPPPPPRARPVKETSWDGLEETGPLITSAPFHSSRDRVPRSARREPSRLPIILGAAAAALVLLGGIATAVVLSTKGEPDSTAGGIGSQTGRSIATGTQGTGTAGNQTWRPDLNGTKGIVKQPTLAFRVDNKGKHRVLLAHKRPVRALAVSRDHARAATGDDAGRVLVWDLEKPSLVFDLGPLPGAVSALTFAPDGQRLGVVAKGVASLWDLKTGKKLTKAAVPAHFLTPTLDAAIDFERHEGTPRMLQRALPDGKLLSFVQTRDSDPTDCSFTADGGRGLIVGMKGLVIHDFKQGRAVNITRDQPTFAPTAACWGRGEKEVYWGNRDGHVALAASLGEPKPKEPLIAPLRRVGVGREGPVTAVALMSDGKYLASAGEDGLIRLTELASGNEAGQFKDTGKPVRRLAVAPGRLLSVGDDGGLWLWDLGGLKAGIPSDKAGTPVIRTFGGHGGPVRGVAFLNNDREVLSAGGYYYRRHDLASGKPLFMSPTTKDRMEVMVSADEKTMLLYAIARGGPAQVWDLTTNKLSFTLGDQTSRFTAGALSASGKYVVMASLDIAPNTKKRRPSEAVLFDARKGKELHRFEVGTTFVSEVGVSPDDKYVYANAAQFNLRGWERESKKALPTAPSQGPQARGPKLLPLDKGQCVLGGYRPGTIVVWDAVGNDKVRSLVGHRLGVIAMALTPDGKRLVSIAGSRVSGGAKKPPVVTAELRVWDFESGKTLGLLPLVELPQSVAVSKDGRRALVGDSRGTVSYIDLTKVKPPPP